MVENSCNFCNCCNFSYLTPSFTGFRWNFVTTLRLKKTPNQMVKKLLTICAFRHNTTTSQTDTDRQTDSDRNGKPGSRLQHANARQKSYGRITFGTRYTIRVIATLKRWWFLVPNHRPDHREAEPILACIITQSVYF